MMTAPNSNSASLWDSLLDRLESFEGNGMRQTLPRGALVRIMSGRYAGRTGVVSSNVFQKTVDYPEEAAQAVHVILGDEMWITVRREQVRQYLKYTSDNSDEASYRSD